MNPDPGNAMPRRLASLAWLTFLLAGTGIAQESPYRLQQPYWPNQYNVPGFRPLPDTNARGAPSNGATERFPPGYAAPPGRIPTLRFPNPWGSTGQQPYRYESPVPRTVAPQLTTVYPTGPVYVQQTLVLTLEVSSETNLKAIDPVLPSTDALVFRKIGGWDARTRTAANGKSKIINRLNYLVTPVRSGEVVLGNIRVEGELSNGRHFSAQTANSATFEVLPPVASVQPWLPLAEFNVSARLINDSEVEEGKPITLIIEQKAVGVTGNQLPSLEPQLREGQYRLYLEDTQHSGQLTNEGKLMGTRVDTFTLVALPKHELLIPTINLTWWNTTTNKRESTILPSRLLSAPGGLMANLSERLSGGPFVAGSAWVFWLPLIVFAFLIGLYWTWIWAKGRRFGQRFRFHIAEKLNPMHSKVGRLLARLSPRRHLHNLRRAFADSLPRSSRLWYCVRVADQETDPTIWSLVLRFLVQRRLAVQAQVPMSELAEIIIDIHPAADAARIRSLLYELNGAVFGNREIQDFERWKSDFKSQVRPRLSISQWLKKTRPSRSELPVLNP